MFSEQFERCVCKLSIKKADTAFCNPAISFKRTDTQVCPYKLFFWGGKYIMEMVRMAALPSFAPSHYHIEYQSNVGADLCIRPICWFV